MADELPPLAAHADLRIRKIGAALLALLDCMLMPPLVEDYSKVLELS